MTVRRGRLCAIRGVFLTFFAVGLCEVASADVPALLRYQGVLALADGSVAPDDLYTLRFRILDSPLQIQAQFEQVLQVGVEAGLYTVLLSDQNGHHLRDAFAGFPRFMEVTILSGGGISTAITLTPTQEIAAVPFALVSGESQTAPVVPTNSTPVPPGAMILWEGPTCPSGYTEATSLRGRFPVGVDTLGLTPLAPSLPQGVGGAEVHAHTGLSSEATGPTDPHLAGAGSGSSASHTHTFSSEQGTHLPPYYTIVFCRKE